MKFIHIADVHFDTPLVSLKNNRELIKKRRTEHRQIFRDVISIAKDENIDYLFVSGDLFENKFVEDTTIQFIIAGFGLIPNTKIFISPGNHDPYVKNSPYQKFDWPENVTIFNGEVGMYSFDDANIYGIGFDDYEFSSDELNELELEDNNKLNILVTHGTLNGASKKYFDISEKVLKKFDYVALGHIHERKVDDSNIIYPGSLMSIGFDELGEHGIIVGTMKKGNIKYEFKNIEERHYEIIEVDISDFKSPDEILNKVDLKDNIYRIVLKGNRTVSIDKIKDILMSTEKNICEIRNNTHIAYAYEDIAKEQNLKGFYTKKMLDEIKKYPERKEEILNALEITYGLF